MTEDTVRVGLLGMPGTGKSTYLGALWQIIEDDDDPSIIERDVTGDRAYLQQLGDDLVAGREVQRTDVDSEDGLTLTVGFDDGEDVALDVPDLSGEALRLLVEDRVWHPRLIELVQTANGFLLFVNVNDTELPTRVDFIRNVMEGAGVTAATSTDDLEQPTDEDADADDGSRFSPRHAYIGAKLVDALENIAGLRSRDDSFHLALILSAWDTHDGKVTPDEWVAKYLAAVASWCRLNTDVVDLAIFGVSAQGGKLPAERDELLQKGSVLNRAFTHDGEGAVVPLSQPLRWALET